MFLGPHGGLHMKFIEKYTHNSKNVRISMKYGC